MQLAIRAYPQITLRILVYGADQTGDRPVLAARSSSQVFKGQRLLAEEIWFRLVEPDPDVGFTILEKCDHAVSTDAVPIGSIVLVADETVVGAIKSHQSSTSCSEPHCAVVVFDHGIGLVRRRRFGRAIVLVWSQRSAIPIKSPNAARRTIDNPKNTCAILVKPEPYAGFTCVNMALDASRIAIELIERPARSNPERARAILTGGLNIVVAQTVRITGSVTIVRHLARFLIEPKETVSCRKPQQPVGVLADVSNDTGIGIVAWSMEAVMLKGFGQRIEAVEKLVSPYPEVSRTIPE
jgi:hypothetical protein